MQIRGQLYTKVCTEKTIVKIYLELSDFTENNLFALDERCFLCIITHSTPFNINQTQWLNHTKEYREGKKFKLLHSPVCQVCG